MQDTAKHHVQVSQFLDLELQSEVVSPGVNLLSRAIPLRKSYSAASESCRQREPMINTSEYMHLCGTAVLPREVEELSLRVPHESPQPHEVHLFKGRQL